MDPSDFIGLLLLILAGGMILRRVVRTRLLSRYTDFDPRCPQCQAGLQRRHRHAGLRFLGPLLGVETRSYRCEICGRTLAVFLPR